MPALDMPALHPPDKQRVLQNLESCKDRLFTAFDELVADLEPSRRALKGRDPLESGGGR